MKSMRTPVSSVLRGRAFSARAATQPGERRLQPTTQNVKVSRLPGGVNVVSLETYSPVSNLAIVYKAGPRYEAPGELGLTHCLRMAVSQSTQKATAFGIAKNLQQIGSTLSCTSNREQMIYAAQCLRDNVPTTVEFLNQVATAPVFKPWELPDIQSKLKLDFELYNKSLDARLMDAVHKAAFRNNLGHPLYMNADRVGTFSTQALEAYVDKHYVSHNATVIGVGIDHDVLLHAVKKLSVRQGAAPTVNKAKFHGGGEVRVDAPGNVVHAAIVHEGVPLGTNDVLPAYVLQQAIGGCGSVQYGFNASSKLVKAALTVTKQPFSASCITINYSDSGLFGIYAVAQTLDIGKVLRAVMNSTSQAIKTGITDADVQRAKCRVKSALLLASEDSTAVLESLSNQILFTNEPETANQLAALVDKVTTEDVNRVAKKISAVKPSMAAVGNLSSTPYLDELL